MSIGSNIRHLRAERGLTQAELAARLEVTQSMGSSIAAALECRIEDLLEE